MIKLISHRGNINGINKGRENSLRYIHEALEQGYDVEIDIWIIDDKIYLGHDNPQTRINLLNIELNENSLWLHCKNIKALDFFKDSFNSFYHTNEDYVLTSKNYIWAYPGKPLLPNIISVLPEKYNYVEKDLIKCYGICSDYIENYKIYK